MAESVLNTPINKTFLVVSGTSSHQEMPAVRYHSEDGNGRQREHRPIHRQQVWHPQTWRRLPRDGGQGIQQEDP